MRRELRDKAVKILKSKKIDFSDESDNQRLIQELSVHQIELELQNEELIKARLAEKAIADKYTQLYDLAPSGYLTLNRQGKIKELNLYAAKMLGRERSKLINAAFDFFLMSETKAVFKSFLTSILERNISLNCSVTLQNHMVIHLTGVLDNDLVNLTAIDITQLKKVEKDNERLLRELLEARKKLTLALENARIGNWEWKSESGELEIDDLLAEMFGITRGKTTLKFSEFEKLVQDEDIPKIRKEFGDAIEKKIPFESIFRIKENDEKSKYLSAKAFINYDKDKKATGLTGVCIDITKIHESSERALIKLNAELSKSNKELQNFAYIASHDLQEPLRMVTSFVQLLERQYADKLDEKAHEYINFAVQGAKRMFDLLNSLLAYSRIRTKENALEEVDMNEIVDKVIDNLRINIRKTAASIQVRNLPVVRADGNQMIQLIQNLIDNSIKFSKNTPHITISSRSNNDHYIFSVKDNGIGISPEYFERIFRIFQRLHTVEEYSGTGVGLAICKNIVERHGGSIWLKSVPGKETTFFFTIPLKPQEAIE